MNMTWITVTGTTVNGWAEGPKPPTNEWFAYDWRPEKSLAAYEYVEVTETITVPDPDDPENSTLEDTMVTGHIIQVRDDWVPETPEEEDTL